MRLAIIYIMLLFLAGAGCYTQRDKVAHKRAQLMLQRMGQTPPTDYTQDDQALCLVIGDECEQANIDSGAAEITEAEAPLDPKASQENAAGIKADRETRQAWIDRGFAVLQKAEGMGGVLGSVGGLLLTAAMWLMKRKSDAEKLQAKAEKAQSSEALGVAGRMIDRFIKPSDQKDHLESEAKSLVTVNTMDVSKAIVDAKIGEI